MKKLVHTYSDLEHSHDQTIALTGATGIIGAHVLAQLVTRPDVESVYCLVPAEDDELRFTVSGSLLSVSSSTS
jgi:nucleoside-diphosphate-sugar epimerase